jgi:5-methylcytosine-specific restriction endonuclease McrA
VETVLVVNADLGPLHRVSLRHAVGMLVRQVAEIHEAVHDRLFGTWPRPTVVRLVRYVATHWRYTTGPSWSRRGVLARDRRTCGYCGGVADTVDHVVPRCRGGRNNWTNTVAACGSCNSAKGNRTPAQAGMTLRRKPIAPSWAALVRR